MAHTPYLFTTHCKKPMICTMQSHSFAYNKYAQNQPHTYKHENHMAISGFKLLSQAVLRNRVIMN